MKRESPLELGVYAAERGPRTADGALLGFGAAFAIAVILTHTGRMTRLRP